MSRELPTLADWLLLIPYSFSARCECFRSPSLDVRLGETVLMTFNTGIGKMGCPVGTAAFAKLSYPLEYHE